MDTGFHSPYGRREGGSCGSPAFGLATRCFSGPHLQNREKRPLPITRFRSLSAPMGGRDGARVRIHRRAGRTGDGPHTSARPDDPHPRSGVRSAQAARWRRRRASPANNFHRQPCRRDNRLRRLRPGTRSSAAALLDNTESGVVISSHAATPHHRQPDPHPGHRRGVAARTRAYYRAHRCGTSWRVAEKSQIRSKTPRRPRCGVFRFQHPFQLKPCSPPIPPRTNTAPATPCAPLRRAWP